jgi:MFS family permease
VYGIPVTADTGHARRDLRIIGFVSAGHFTSHFFQLTLPAVFPLLRGQFDVSYVALGFIVSVFYAASGVGQTISGFLVDRFGARRVLLTGFTVFATAMALAGMSVSYWMLVAITPFAGLGNSVFHPADYAIFNDVVDPRRLGRAYSVHSVLGNLGWVAAPIVIVGCSALFGWRIAVTAAGVAGLGVALVLAWQTRGLADHRAPRTAPASPGSGVLRDLRVLMIAPVLLAFVYFALLSTAYVGIQTFGVPALVSIYGAPLSLATGALTGFLLGSTAGTLAGGFLADRTRRHGLVAGVGMLPCVALTLAVAGGGLPLGVIAGALGFVGFFLGVTQPSRDMLVRDATPRGASGKVFGFVYSGLDLGSALTPPALGWVMDRGEPRAVFFAIAAFMVVTLVTVLEVRRRSAA